MAGDRFFEHVEEFLKETLKDLSSGFSGGYASTLSSLFPSAVTIFILYKAYQILAGKVQSPVAEIIWDLAVKIMILAVVTNYGGYLSLALSAVDGIKESFVGGDSIFSLLDDQLEIAQSLAGTIYALDESDYVPLAGAIGAAGVWLGTGIALLVAGIILLVAEITLKLLAITAPIFIFCLMWGFLRQMFNQWLQLIFANIITVLYVGIVGRLGINFFKSILDGLTSNLGAEKASNAGFISSGSVAEASLYTSGFIALCAGIIIGVFIYLSLDLGRNLATVSVEGGATALANSSLGRSLGITQKSLQRFLNSGRSGWRFGRGIGQGWNSNKQPQGVPNQGSYAERAGRITGRAGRNLINFLRNQGGRDKLPPPT
ncbi:hypothetical protein BKK50_09975 [Rodentibacter rarus]|uniref:Conjugal transfer protein TrbL n=1 Tax=Rodentibacter rarus TaxID=1908260 RepID=A0A1V3IGZ7_9PAST|nr:type IV secretion system protein [Rodentibacter rarus]OOF40058.1 hypothetical protein BKK50_09975 [Rodentibacter rarus]